MTIRELLKRNLPRPIAQELGRSMRAIVAGRPLERILLHNYVAIPDPSTAPRISLFIPNVLASTMFGGVATGLDIFFELGRRTGAELRIVADEYGSALDESVVRRRPGAKDAHLVLERRNAETPHIQIRASEVFLAYSWWTALNVRHLVDQQATLFGGSRRPSIYLVQDYEPQFYPFSSTHMMARQALGGSRPWWAIYNSGELHEYVAAQGHKADRSFTFEPRLSDSLRPFLRRPRPAKTKTILVYSRPVIARNCYPLITAGLETWARRYTRYADWRVVSAGLAHPPVALSQKQKLIPLGKLSLEEYAEVMLETAVGLSLMASPHPSYPPLEMAHFGIRTITNSYTNKNLALSHSNLVSLAELDPDSIADALAEACAAFESDPGGGWKAESHRPSFMAEGQFPFLDELASAIQAEFWT